MDGDDARMLAGMRSALASQAKRVPSKEAMASIEKVKINDLAQDERCKLFYNSI